MADSAIAPLDVVTIGIPVVAELATFELAVKSVFAQTHQSWELVIVCDGSPPGIVQTARAIRDPRVRVVADGLGLGLPARLNQITEMSSTRLVARMDADDIMHPMRLEKQVRFLRDHPSVDLVGTGSWVIDDADKVAGLNIDPPIPSTPRDWIGRTVFCHPSVMFTRAWAQRFPYSEAYLRAEDKELWIRSQAASAFARIDQPLMYYRIPRRWNIRKRALGYASDRRLTRDIWRNVGARRIDWMREDGRLWARQLLLPALAIPGVRELTYRRKFSTVLNAERDEAQRTINDIASTPVPGWDI